MGKKMICSRCNKEFEPAKDFWEKYKKNPQLVTTIKCPTCERATIKEAFEKEMDDFPAKVLKEKSTASSDDLILAQLMTSVDQAHKNDRVSLSQVYRIISRFYEKKDYKRTEPISSF